MSQEEFQQRVAELVVEALELGIDERETYLNNACVGHPALLAEARSLLSFELEAEDKGFMNVSAFELSASKIAAEQMEEDRVGQFVGRYELLSLIGEGGMGEVYLAQDTELNRHVAIKLVKSNLKTKELLRRFMSEQRILANLNHLNITKLLDAGTTVDGLPFLVMEYVEGQPITHYAEAHKLPIIERLKLFRTICAAVQYAHQHLIIHRDLKPSNILVTNEGVPKLLDFGIAKLLPPDTASGQAMDKTVTLLRVMTPEYASPEQITGESITTVSDVYSLGVVLYEFLTGHSPYQLKNRRPEELVRAICERTPPRPSTAVSRPAEAVNTNAVQPRTKTPATMNEAQTQAERLKLQRSLRGDLDNIVLKAMHKDPARRYSSVGQFSEDIRRYLEGLPVIARKDTLTYRATKFVRRNQLGVAAAALIILVLLGGVVATTWEAHVARQERAKAEARFSEVRKLAHSVLFDYHDAIATLPGATPVRERLVKDALEYLDNLAREAGDNEGLQQELASAYLKVGDVQGKPFRSNLGDTPGALASYYKALTILENLSNTAPAHLEVKRDLSIAYENVGNIQTRLMQRAEAVASQRKALAIRQGLLAIDPTNMEYRRLLADSYFNLGDALIAGQSNVFNEMPWAAALESFQQSLPIREQLFAANPTNALDGRNLAQSYQRIGNVLGETAKGLDGYRVAMESHRKSVEIRERLVASNPQSAQARRDLADEYNMKAMVQTRTGDGAAALDDCRKALVTFEELAADDPTNTEARQDIGFNHYVTGMVLWKINDTRRAAASFKRAIQSFEALSAADPTNVGNYIDAASAANLLSQLLEKTGDLPGAIESYHTLVALAEKIAALNPLDAMTQREVANKCSTLAGAYVKLATETKTSTNKRQKSWREARNWYQKSLEIWQNLRDKGTLSNSDTGKPDEVARNMETCDSALEKFRDK